MNIYVLLKRTFDSEEKVQVSNGSISKDDAEFIINPYDEYAIEEGVKLRDIHGGKVIVISVDIEEAETQLRTALAMGIDQAVLINIGVDLEKGDQFTTVRILEAFFEDKEFDLILAGNMAIDEASGQVGPRLAEKLNIPCVTTITKIEIDGEVAEIERNSEGGVEKIQTTLPLIVTCQQGLNEPRYPSLPGIMKAKNKPLEVVELADLKLEAEDVKAKTETIEIYLPPEKEVGKVLKGEIEDQVKELVSLLKAEAKVI